MKTVHAARVFSLDPNLPGYIGVPNADAQVQTPNKKNHCLLMMCDQLTHFTGGVHDELDRAAPYPPGVVMAEARFPHGAY